MNEAKFVALYRELTGCDETFARSVYIHVLPFYLQAHEPANIGNDVGPATPRVAGAVGHVTNVSQLKPSPATVRLASV